MSKNTEPKNQSQARPRKFGKNPSRPLPVWNGILEPKHRRKIGNALWLLLYLIDKITVEELDGPDLRSGYCLGKTPIDLKRVARAMGVHPNTVYKDAATLDEYGYITRKLTPRGYIIGVTNSRKFGIWKAVESGSHDSVNHTEVVHSFRDSGSQDSVTGGSQETVNARHLRSKELHNTKTTSKTIPHKPRAASVEATKIPDWIPLPTWNEYLTFRASKDRKPLSTFAQSLAVKKLDELRSSGHDPSAVLEQTILNNWSGLFPIRAAHTNKLTPDELTETNLRNAGFASNTRFERNMRAAGLTPDKGKVN